MDSPPRFSRYPIDLYESCSLDPMSNTQEMLADLDATVAAREAQ